MTLLTDVLWLTIGAAIVGWCAVALRPRIGDDLERVADAADRLAAAWLRRRARTHVDRLARRAASSERTTPR